jgi:hypothetical protein
VRATQRALLFGDSPSFLHSGTPSSIHFFIRPPLRPFVPHSVTPSTLHSFILVTLPPSLLQQLVEGVTE